MLKLFATLLASHSSHVRVHGGAEVMVGVGKRTTSKVRGLSIEALSKAFAKLLVIGVTIKGREA